ncbi:transmembrane protease serine 9-like isoform 2 [Aphelenchoides avenae]|nr:transmembrane protease serine 9-like isoform 2 [Aphelenchus avenae]
MLVSEHCANGSVTNQNEFPFIVKLEYSFNGTVSNPAQRSCAGTIISDRHVLTARRCVDAKGPDGRSNEELRPEDVSVRFATNVNYGKPIAVKSIRPYFKEGFEEGYYAELAVLELDIPITFWIGDEARHICLSSDLEYIPDTKLVVLHWGTEQAGEPGGHPLCIKEYDLTDYYENCHSWVHERLPEHEFVNDNLCFGHLVEDKKHLDVAYKSLDFGGIIAGSPVIVQKEGRWLQVGIVSRLDAEGDLPTHLFGIATRIALFSHAIQELTDCYIYGDGLDQRQSKGIKPPGCKDDDGNYTKTPTNGTDGMYTKAPIHGTDGMYTKAPVTSQLSLSWLGRELSHYGQH